MDPLELPVGKVVPRDERVMRGTRGAWMLRRPLGWTVGDDRGALEAEAVIVRQTAERAGIAVQ